MENALAKSALRRYLEAGVTRILNLRGFEKMKTFRGQRMENPIRLTTLSGKAMIKCCTGCYTDQAVRTIACARVVFVKNAGRLQDGEPPAKLAMSRSVLPMIFEVLR